MITVRFLEGCCGFGLLVLAAQLAVLSRFRRRPSPRERRATPISVLKPLCGMDDALRTNLESFVAQTHPEYELLLGVEDTSDEAFPLAMSFARAWPGRVRVIEQRGAPGLNPKVNQLITLQRAARHPLVVISDSNVRVHPTYLSEISSALDDPAVGLVTHPVVGAGGAGLGARLDNLHLTAGVTPGVVSVKHAVGQDIVVGKSMAFRASDVARLGGFESVCDVLAEDFILGRRLRAELGMRVELLPQPVVNLSRDAGCWSFVQRFTRWSVMQRRVVGPWLYGLQVFLNPTPFALAAAILRPSSATGLALGLAWLLRAAIDAGAWRVLAGARPEVETLALGPLRDVLVLLCWVRGLVEDRIAWRGKELRVGPGSRLSPVRRSRPRLANT